MRNDFAIAAIIVVVALALISLVWPPVLWSLLFFGPVILLGIYDMYQTRHALWRTFPVLAHGRWVMEFIRPFLRQYLFESETDGVPINRMYRTVIYQRAKGVNDTIPYGTKVDTDRVGYEWIGHSLTAKSLYHEKCNPRILIGGKDCKQPYSASILNISAMSFGSLSNNAIRALNKGAAIGGFSHNSGEGSVSPYHLEHEGDITWQIGTGYFGCRDGQGNFSPENFKQMAVFPSIKMIEIKLSQGAKPGHGGILPAGKNTSEIARIRAVEPGVSVNSPSTHSRFSTPIEMMHFIQELRELSGGKPIGFKLCIGRESEFFSICKAMVKTGIKPDFITVDGGEGGTGAAPLEYSNSVGMPLKEALILVCDTLIGFGLKQEIKVISSGKIFTGFHLVRNIAMGADACNSARGMMVALGCVQSLICNTNHCPVGVATQDPELVKGLVVSNKAERVAKYHHETTKAALDITSSAGFTDTQSLNRSHIFRRVSHMEVKRLDEIYPYPADGCFLTEQYPKRYHQEMVESSAESFMPEVFYTQSSEGLAKLE